MLRPKHSNIFDSFRRSTPVCFPNYVHGATEVVVEGLLLSARHKDIGRGLRMPNPRLIDDANDDPLRVTLELLGRSKGMTKRAKHKELWRIAFHVGEDSAI